MIEERICEKCGLMSPHIRGACLVCQEIDLTPEEARELQFWADGAVYRITGRLKEIGDEEPDYE